MSVSIGTLVAENGASAAQKVIQCIEATSSVKHFALTSFDKMHIFAGSIAPIKTAPSGQKSAARVLSNHIVILCAGTA